MRPTRAKSVKNTCPTGVTTHDKRLQKGLNPGDKAVRVANYCRNMRHDVEVIAHSCGAPHARRLRRFHVRIVGPDGVSRSLSELYPTDDLADSSAIAARSQAKSSEKTPGVI